MVWALAVSPDLSQGVSLDLHRPRTANRQTGGIDLPSGMGIIEG